MGKQTISIFSGVGSITLFLYKFFYWFIKPPFRIKLIMDQLYFIGNKSVFIIVLSGVFTGMVLAYQTYFGFKLINVDSLVGPVVALSMARELAPVLTGLIVSGRAGGAMAAQIGTMKVTEQIDALEVMGINSFQYLAVPRIIAGTISLPLLSILFLLVGNIGGWFVGTQALMIDEAIFFSKLSEFMFMADLYQGLIKATFFGFFISVIGTYFGFSVSKGAEGVGRGTNLSVVWGMITVLITDYLLTSILVKIL
ncbi:MAG: ABC transporter permease [Halobacteriovoraceae bacterium]|nr:ABC transporter permease [Halobacteriovoraceae bacterium]